MNTELKTTKDNLYEKFDSIQTEIEKSEDTNFLTKQILKQCQVAKKINRIEGDN